MHDKRQYSVSNKLSHRERDQTEKRIDDRKILVKQSHLAPAASTAGHDPTLRLSMSCLMWIYFVGPTNFEFLICHSLDETGYSRYI